MKKLCCFVMLFFTCRVCVGQNLVSNGDFEQYTTCPYGYNQLNFTMYWSNPTVPPPTGGSPEYFNHCDVVNIVGVPQNSFGYQQAHSGDGYCGIALWALSPSDFREYVEVPLTSTLLANACYHFEMFVSSANGLKYSSDDIGVYFSTSLISGVGNYLPLPFAPQINNVTGNIADTLNWKLISGNFTAGGGENYLIIGNFKDDANTDTFPVNNAGYGGNVYFYIDDVSLTICTDISEYNEDVAINIYPNPVADKINFTVNNKELSEIILYDIASRKLLQQQFTNSVTLNTEQLAKGIYIYEVRDKNGVIKKGKVVKE